MKKIILIIFALLLIVVVVELGILYFSRKKALAPVSTDTQQEPTLVKSTPVKVGNLNFVTGSEVDGMTLEFSDKKGLEAYLKEKGIMQNIIVKGMGVLGETQIQFPKTMEISLTSQTQNFLKLLSVDENNQQIETRSIGSGWDDVTKTYQLKVYFNQEVIKQAIKEGTIETFVTDAILQALHIVSSPKLSDEETIKAIEDISREVGERNLKFFAIKEVYTH